jgi:quercetin dioxygenase-like cupin family protein
VPKTALSELRHSDALPWCFSRNGGIGIISSLNIWATLQKFQDEGRFMRMRFVLCGLLLFTWAVPFLLAQDSVKADPKHYSVVSENDQVRIVRVHYGPHEKSVMHSHPNLVAIFLNDATGKFVFPDGKTQDFTSKAGQAQYVSASTHLPENTGDMPMDIVLVELKM